NGLNPADNEAVRQLAQRCALVKPAFGLYPVDAVLEEMLAMGVDYERDGEAFSGADGVAWVRDHVDEAFAIGEIGLDGYWVPSQLWPRQEELFRQLVELAIEADKPISVHSRKRERRVFDIVVELGAKRVDWHCFSSKVKLGLQIAATEGQYLSIPANARKAENFTKLLRELPRDRVLLETDCPYLAPVRGQVNEPANVAVTIQLAAELWECSEEQVVTQLEENFERLYGVAP
ncbi:MAG: TatD family hydrolase, partial [Proteobacteria bacterium]|nr:TatD family hydrolase [Pseudomonadota bacterium]